LYEQGFTISGARNRLDSRLCDDAEVENTEIVEPPIEEIPPIDPLALRRELQAILDTLSPVIENHSVGQ
jgi:hypothetical protein